MRYLAVLTLVCLAGLATPPAAAEPIAGYVVEADRASPEVGRPVSAGTAVSVEAGGHIVVMALNGRMVRQAGPYDGTAAAILAAAEGLGEAPDLGTEMLGSLLELAAENQVSQTAVGGTRGLEAGRDVHAEAITAGTRIYCLRPGERPRFYMSRPPARDEPLILRRRVAPRSYREATWPVGATQVPWPADWPTPAEGRYIWSLGDEVRAPVWLRGIEEPPEDPLDRAAFYFNMRCESQAIALFRAALRTAPHR